MVRTEQIGSRFFAEIITDLTDVGTLGNLEVDGEELGNIVIIPSGYICNVKADIIYSGTNSSTPIFQSCTLRGTVRNNGGTISILTTQSSDLYGASGMSAPPEASFSFTAGSSGFDVEVDQSGADATGNYSSAHIFVVGHVYDTGA